MLRIGWMTTLVVAGGLLAVCIFSPAGWGQSQPATEQAQPEPEELMTRALDAILAGSYDEAYEQLRLAAAEPLRETKEAFEGFSLQTQKAFELWGKPADYELARRQAAGPHLVRLHYVVRCPRHPVCWRATFYRPATSWQLINIAFSEDLDPMFGD